MVRDTVFYKHNFLFYYFFQSSYGITDAQTSHADSILSCTFKRKISYTSGSAPARKKRVAVDGTTFFDLSTPWHLLVAVGDMNSGTCKHRILRLEMR